MSVISGFFMIIATAVAKSDVLWDVVYGTVHRKFEFEKEVLLIDFDEEFGVWIVIELEIMFVHVNGEVVGRMKVPEKVTVLTAIGLKGNVCDRSAIAGTETGGLFLISPRIDLLRMDYVKLPSEHRSQIEKVVINAELTEFVSVDREGRTFVWHGVGVECGCSKPEILLGCGLCGGKAEVCCVRCHRGICGRCLKRGNELKTLCPLCAVE